MIMHINKKLLLISFFMTSIIGAGEKLTQDNCIAIAVSDSETFPNQTRDSIWFFDKQHQFLRRTEYFAQAIKSVTWHNKKTGVLKITFQDESVSQIDINKPLQSE